MRLSAAQTCVSDAAYAGYGVFTRPSLRILYGLQYSTQNEAFGNSFSTSQSDDNTFGTKEQHLHQMIGLEAEAWF